MERLELKDTSELPIQHPWYEPKMELVPDENGPYVRMKDVEKAVSFIVGDLSSYIQSPVTRNIIHKSILKHLNIK